MHRHRVGADVLASVPEVQSAHRGWLWFLGKASIGYTSQVVLSTLAVTLPASSVTVLSLANKVVGAISTTLTNAVMPVLVHQATETYAAARRFLRVLVGLLLLVGFVGTVMVALIDSRHVVAAMVVSLWTMTSAAAAVAQRTAFRFLPAQAAGGVMAAVLVIVTVTVAAAGLPGFDVIVLLCAYAALDAATAMLLLWSLKDRAASAATAVAFTVLLGLAGIAVT
jgi:hypothetical protein